MSSLFCSLFIRFHSIIFRLSLEQKTPPPPANYLGRRKRGAFITYMQFNELIDIIYKDITRPEDSNPPRHMVPETIALSPPELRAHEKIRQD